MTDTTLFDGDTGSLPVETRQLLVSLLKGPYLDGSENAAHWAVLLREEDRLRSWLSDLFLTLVIDADLKIAFTCQVPTGSTGVPVLLRRISLTFKDTVLLLRLREEYSKARSSGSRCVVDISELVDHLKIYAGPKDTDLVKHDKASMAAIERLIKNGILMPLSGSKERAEVSPVIAMMIGIAQLEALSEAYAALLKNNGAALAEDTVGAPADTNGELVEA